MLAIKDLQMLTRLKTALVGPSEIQSASLNAMECVVHCERSKRGSGIIVIPHRQPIPGHLRRYRTSTHTHRKLIVDR